MPDVKMVDFTFKRPWTYAGVEVCQDGKPQTIKVHEHRVESLKARGADKPVEKSSEGGNS